jgi:hypothetical protein
MNHHHTSISVFAQVGSVVLRDSCYVYSAALVPKNIVEIMPLDFSEKAARLRQAKVIIADWEENHVPHHLAFEIESGNQAGQKVSKGSSKKVQTTRDASEAQGLSFYGKGKPYILNNYSPEQPQQVMSPFLSPQLTHQPQQVMSLYLSPHHSCIFLMPVGGDMCVNRWTAPYSKAVNEFWCRISISPLLSLCVLCAQFKVHLVSKSGKSLSLQKLTKHFGALNKVASSKIRATLQKILNLQGCNNLVCC